MSMYPRLWHPDNLGRDKLAAWWDPNDQGSTNMTNDGAGLISAWRDRMNGLTVAAAGTARPTWAATSFNSLYQGLTFDGVDDVLIVASTGVLPVGTNEGWIFALANQTDTADIDGQIAYGTHASPQVRGFLKSAGDRLQLATEGTPLTDSGTTFTGMKLAAGRFGPGGLTLEGWINDAPTTPPSVATSFNTGTATTRLGAYLGGLYYFQGVMSHMMVIRGPLSTLERNRLSAWLLWNTGLQANLAANHPFRNERP